MSKTLTECLYYQDELAILYCGDCREIMPQLGSFDVLLTDPPYGLGENAKRVKSRGKLAAATDYGSFTWDSQPPSQFDLYKARSRALRSIIWGGNYFELPPSPAWLVWDKQNGSNDFADCELAWTNLPQAVRMFRFMWNGMLRAGEARKKARVHPTQKPVELMRWCLEFVPNAKTVLDPYCGSGTSLVAAKMLGLRCVGIELDERYCRAAARRLSEDFLPLFGGNPEPLRKLDTPEMLTAK